jgi:cell division septation protein DedD
VLHDPYTNTVITFTRGQGTSALIQIDHVVALGDAWQTGAQQLSLAVRTNLANDPLELLAVSGAANEQKGDANAASWLPANKAFRCPYVAIQVAVKIRYHLWVTPGEHDAIAMVLSSCPTQPLPTGGPPATASSTTVVPPTPALSTPTPAPSTPAPAPTTPVPNVPIVHPGAFCSPPGARGVTSAGTPMTCKLDGTEQHYRWSKA